jgi:hypothetical protein
MNLNITLNLFASKFTSEQRLYNLRSGLTRAIFSPSGKALLHLHRISPHTSSSRQRQQDTVSRGAEDNPSSALECEGCEYHTAILINIVASYLMENNGPQEAHSNPYGTHLR